jgi:Eco57I restriction-modification methylase/TaqI-like C-terminal specificity domain
LSCDTGLYADYCLTRIRQEVAERKSARKPFPVSAKTYWPRLQSIFRAIAEGDDDLGIPPYNGGLFDRDAAPILERTSLNDAIVAEVVFRLSHQYDPKSGLPPKYINYRDLSVQQLGSVYEQILEHGLRLNDDGKLVIAADASGRKVSGSYYTPEELVGLIIERAVGPLVEEQLTSFRTTAERNTSDTRPIPTRLSELAALDPASGLLDLKICDPAMGSGHFLVSLVDWLADRVLAAMAEATATVTFGSYASPLVLRIASIRAKILGAAKSHKWPIVESQLDDRHIVRRMVLKRVVYGVDKNPMAVELAKVALWLHSFTVGAPLSFLDHHLRCGDSVVGAWAHPMLVKLQSLGALFSNGLITRVELVSKVMGKIEDTTDNDIAEVSESKSKFLTVAEATEPVASFFSPMTAETLMGVLDAAPRKEPPPIEHLVTAGKSEKFIQKASADRQAFERAAGFRLALDGTFGDPIRIATGEIRITPKDTVRQLSLLEKDERRGRKPELFQNMGVDARRHVTAEVLVTEALAIGKHHRFFHWEIGFPNVWSNLLSSQPAGGFDAIIGNPPYVRQELLGEIKPALKKAYRSFDGVADLYIYFYEQGLRLLRPGGRMSYVVTNKWLKAGYAENLRELFTDPAHTELEFVADFGHAKHFFPDADVFPSVVVVRKPELSAAATANPTTQVCVIPRDLVPRKGLLAAVAEASYPLPFVAFSKDSWTLEPPAVIQLLSKIRQNGVSLESFIPEKPSYGVKTGLNEAFLVDTAIRDQLVRDDPKCTDIIKPYLRGQDIERWAAPWSGLWMIFARRGIEISKYPSIKRYLSKFRARLESKPGEWKPKADEKWSGRKEGNYEWYEIQDTVDYWPQLDAPKIVYGDIAWSASFAIDRSGLYVNNTGYFIGSDNTWIVACLNSPLAWLVFVEKGTTWKG